MDFVSQDGAAEGNNRDYSPSEDIPRRDECRTGIAGATDLQRRLDKSRLRALEQLSSVLFTGSAPAEDPSRSPRSTERSGRTRPRAVGSHVGKETLLAERLRRAAHKVLQEERNRLSIDLRKELAAEKLAFASRKASMTEEVFCTAKQEMSAALDKNEREMRLLLARREYEDLKKLEHERLLLNHAREKEKVLRRLRSSLGRGKGHSMEDLRMSLLDEAQEEKSRALREGEAAFEHSCRRLKERWDEITMNKLEVMEREARVSLNEALAKLREGEVMRTDDDLEDYTKVLQAAADKAEDELTRALEREAAQRVSGAVESSTRRHKRFQEESAARAAEALKRVLEETAQDESKKTEMLLQRERRHLHQQRECFIDALEERIGQLSLRGLENGVLHHEESGTFDADATVVQHSSWLSDTTCNSNRRIITPKIRTFAEFVSHVDTLIHAAESAYSSISGDIIRARAAEVLQEKAGACSKEAIQGLGDCPSGCRGCTRLFDENEDLLREVKFKGRVSHLVG